MEAPHHTPPQPHSHSQFPPSPPPSPPAARRRLKKKSSDPFLSLGAVSTPLTSPSPPSSPTKSPAEPEEPLLTRIILTPLLFISFLLSLFLVNRSDRARRARRARRASHPSRSSTLLSYISPSAWIDPEPYQDPTDSTWDRRGSTSHATPPAAIAPREGSGLDQRRGKRRSWHLHRKIRKVARLEITDAFEMRGRVLLVMGLVGVGVTGGALLGLRWVVRMVWR